MRPGVALLHTVSMFCIDVGADVTNRPNPANTSLYQLWDHFVLLNFVHYDTEICIMKYAYACGFNVLY